MLDALSNARVEIVNGDGTHQALVVLAGQLESQAQALGEQGGTGPLDIAPAISGLAERTSSAAQAYEDFVGRTTPEEFRAGDSEDLYEELDSSTTPPTLELVNEIRDFVADDSFAELSRIEQEGRAQDPATSSNEAACPTAARRLLSTHE